MNWRRTILQFLCLFGFWQLLSWRADPLYITIGLLSAAAITAITGFLADTVYGSRVGHPLRRVPLLVLRWLAFAGWLFSRMVVAGLQIARLSLDPKLPLDPVELKFRTELSSPLARTLFTNSITLVPGTLTVDLDGEWVYVHALFPSATDDLLSGALQNRIARLFDEPVQPPASPTWVALPSATPGVADPTDSTLNPEAPREVSLGWGWEANEPVAGTDDADRGAGQAGGDTSGEAREAQP